MTQAVTHQVCEVVFSQSFPPGLGHHLVGGFPRDEGGEGMRVLQRRHCHRVGDDFGGLLLGEAGDGHHGYLDLEEQDVYFPQLVAPYPGDITKDVGMEGDIVLGDVEMTL